MSVFFKNVAISPDVSFTFRNELHHEKRCLWYTLIYNAQHRKRALMSYANSEGQNLSSIDQN